jgi:hypothetical protein
MVKKLLFFFIFLFFLLFLPMGFCAEYAIGVSPGVVELGEVEPGSKKTVNFFLITPSEDTIYLYLEPFERGMDFFRVKYKDLIQEVSEEKVADWADVIKTPLKLEAVPGAEEIFGRHARGYRRVNFILNVPEDAEPGYHVFAIRPKPRVTPGPGGQVAVQIVAITPVSVLFRVPGEVVRDGDIIGIVAAGMRDSELPVNIYFKNTGTVTISAKVLEANLSANGRLVQKSSSPESLLKPGEKKPLTVLFRNVTPGEYVVSALVDFTTGKARVEQSVYAFRALVPPKVVEKKPEIPVWSIFLIFILIVIYIIYKKKYAEE